VRRPPARADDARLALGDAVGDRLAAALGGRRLSAKAGNDSSTAWTIGSSIPSRTISVSMKPK